MDITMCKGNGCLLSLKCKRYLAKPGMHQSYFTDAPYRVVNDKTECAYFWEVSQSSELTQLKETTDEERRIAETDIGGIEETEQTTGERFEGSGE